MAETDIQNKKGRGVNTRP